jgi:hypothetical protein
MRKLSRRLAILAMTATAGAFVASCNAQGDYGARGGYPIVSVAGTTWVGTDSRGDYYEYTFQPNGEMDYKSPDGYFTNGGWRQHGNAISMETNNGFSVRQGRIYGAHMQGAARNVKHERWEWEADKR